MTTEVLFSSRVLSKVQSYNLVVRHSKTQSINLFLTSHLDDCHVMTTFCESSSEPLAILLEGHRRYYKMLKDSQP